MRFGGGFLRSKVGRRVFALFVLSALIPIAFLSIFSYRQVTQLLIEQTYRELAVFSASYGSAAYDHLLLAERTLVSASAALMRGASADDIQKQASPTLQALIRMGPGASRTVVFGRDTQVAAASEADTERLRRGEPLLLETSPAGDGTSRGVAIARLVDGAQPDRGWLLADISPLFLWGQPDDLPYMIRVCVFNARRIPLYCSHPESRGALQEVVAIQRIGSAGSFLSVQAGGETHLAAAREVFVASHFGKEFFTVVASRPESAALAPVSAFRTIFWGSVILSALVALLLSASQIRRTLIPLERLIAGTRRVAQRDFSTPVTVRRSDEFGELAQTFNAMSSRLNRQFNVLGALSRIDRSILTDLNVTRVIDEVLSQLPGMVRADTAAVFVLKHDSEREGESHVLAPDQGEKRVVNVVLDSPVRALISHEPKGMWCANEHAETLRALFGLPSASAQRYFVLPVMVQDRLCGALLLGWRDAVKPDEDDIIQVRDFADRIGVVLSSSAREAKLHYQARYDALTDLPNRYLFVERLAQEMSRAKREDRALILLFIALDRFKQVSDAHGHAAGDALVREAALRLRQHVREGDTVARFGGQEFAIALSGDLGPKQADVVSRHVIEAMAKPFVIDQIESFISVSIGIAVYPQDGATAGDLLRNADTACARAGGHGFVYFTESMNQHAVARARLDRELRHAVEQRQFLLYYQPKIDLQSGRIVAAEALIRWQHPERGLVNPGAFIEVAEETGLIIDLGQFALAEACRQFSAWRENGIELQQIAVNVSSRQFRSHDVVTLVEQQIRRNRLQSGELELEVTESVMVDNFDDVTSVLKQFRTQGASIALDDFGTGYSSMRYLETLPFDTLKIDMSFVRTIKDNGEGGAIAEAIIKLAHTFGKKVVAEGVETAGQAALLKQLGCHVAQGYLYGRPLPPAEFELLFRRQRVTST